MFIALSRHILLAATICLSQTANSRDLAIVGATLIDGTGASPVPDAVVIVRNGEIVDVGRRGNTIIPQNVDVIDARGKWLTPSLIDAHVHFFQSGGLYTRPDVIDLRDERSYDDEIARIKDNTSYTLSRYICSGITAVVDAGGPLWTLALKDKFHASPNAPRLAFAGPLISSMVPEKLTAKDPANIQLAGPAETRHIVRYLAEKGADFIKLWLPKQEDYSTLWHSVEAAIDEAHRRHLRVMVHATERELARRAVLAGADILAHSVFDRVIDDDMLALLKARKVIYIPTLQVRKGYREVLEGNAVINNFDETCGDHDVIATWQDLPAPEDRAGFADISVATENLRRIHRAEIMIAAGSDAGNIGTLHGPGLHRELQLLVDAGLTPHQALITATRNAAHVFANDPNTGTIQKGKRADLLILSADPLANIRHLTSINTVIKDGIVVKRSPQ